MTPQYAPSTLSFKVKKNVVAQMMKQPMMRSFKQWKEALSAHADSKGTSDKPDAISSIEHFETTVHSGPNLEDIYVKQELMETALATVIAAVMEIKDSLRLIPAADLGGDLETREPKSQISQHRHSNGSAETFVVCPVAAKERAEEAELRNQKQTYVADLQQLQVQQHGLQQLQAELRDQKPTSVQFFHQPVSARKGEGKKRATENPSAFGMQLPFSDTDLVKVEDRTATLLKKYSQKLRSDSKADTYMRFDCE